MTRLRDVAWWVAGVAVCLFMLWWALGCAPPVPACAGPFCYDAANDLIHIDDAYLTIVAAQYGQPGVEWITAHEEGHRTMMRRWRQDHVALWTLMPGPGARIQIEQVAQCLAALSGVVQPWEYGPDEVAAGYWDCSPEYQALVAAA